jgi:uncharacterized protein (UPF0305 family)
MIARLANHFLVHEVSTCFEQVGLQGPGSEEVSDDDGVFYCLIGES